MANVKNLEIETRRLASDIESLRQHLEGMRKSGENMMTQLAQLDAMWDGDAKKAFKTQFTSDYETLNLMADILEDLIRDLEESKTRYDKCEKNVGMIVQALNV